MLLGNSSGKARRLVILLLVISLAALGGYGAVRARTAPAAPATVPSEPAPPPLPAPEPVSIRLVAAGDNLIHDNIYQQAAARAGGSGFDFVPPYQYVAPLIAGADVAFVNQETIIAEGKFPLSGYPCFNSPEEVGHQIEQMGFNVVNIANNHMLDMGELGLISALDFWQAKDRILTIGAWRQESEMQNPLLFEAQGITLGFVPVTEHTNGLGLPGGTALRYILSDEYGLMKEQVALAKQYADFTVVSIHWGTESSISVNDNQQMLAQMFADWGVDLVLGHHSHTLQPMEWRAGASGNQTLVVYSLGNLLSSMNEPQHMLGGVLNLQITKDLVTGETTITDAAMIPIITQFEGAARNEVRSYPFSQYTNDLASRHSLRAVYGSFGIPYFRGIVEKNIPPEFLRDPLP